MFKNLKILNSVIVSLSFALAPLAYAQQKKMSESEAKAINQKAALSQSGSTGKTAQAAAPSTVPSDTTKPQDMNEAESGGLVATKADFMRFFGEYKRLAETKIVDAKFKAADAAYGKYLDNWDTCVNGQKAAAYACLSNLSPSIQDGVAAINSLMAVAGAAAVKDSCSSMGKAMGIAQAALTAYTAACGAAKGHCGWYCSASKKALPELQQALSGDYKCVNEQDPSCARNMPRYADLRATLLNLAKQELAPKDIQSIAGKTEICTSKYAQLLLSAGTGLYGVVNAIKQANSCEEASDADSSVAGTTTAEKCAIESNANLPECICLKNPMLEGCGSTSARSSMNASEGGLSALSAGSSEAGKDGLSAADLAVGSTDPEMPGARNPSSSAGGVGAPVGGGGANLSGGGGFGSGAAAGEGKDDHKPLDTNILGGGGGGGGGGAWGSGGDGDGDKSGYRSYLPGGAKDPLKMNGGATNASKEVTGQGGKSNWEKVRERYQDNRSSLLNN